MCSHRCRETFVFGVFRVAGGVGCWVDAALPPEPHHLPPTHCWTLLAARWICNLQWQRQQCVQYPPVLANVVLYLLGIYFSSRCKHAPWKMWRKPYSRGLGVTGAVQGDRVRGREVSGQVETSGGCSFSNNVFMFIAKCFLWVLCPFKSPVSQLNAVLRFQIIIRKD